MAQEWRSFSVGTPSTRNNWTEPDCIPFTEVTHVTHIHSAVEVIRLGKIRQSLVFDESILNDRRVLVSWCSPNWWNPGFRYGNVAFRFDWAGLIARRRYYWVESIAYGIKACRLLVTDREHADLEEYDPGVGDGPWWHDEESDKHYFNGNYCLEIMVESDLDVDDSLGCKFVDHHQYQCSIDPRNCKDRNRRASVGGAMLLGRLVGERVGVPAGLLTQRADRSKPSDELRLAWNEWRLVARSRDTDVGGPVESTTPGSRELARAILRAYGAGNDDFLMLAALFRSRQDLEQATREAVAEHFGIADLASLDLF